MLTNCIQKLSLDIHICLCFYEKCSGFVHVPRESCFSFYFKNKNNICSYHHTLATKILFIILELLTPWTQDINWKYIRRSEDALESTERLMHVQFTSCAQGGGMKYSVKNCVRNGPKHLVKTAGWVVSEK